jgi:hypothetical protein
MAAPRAARSLQVGPGAFETVRSQPHTGATSLVPAFAGVTADVS